LTNPEKLQKKCSVQQHCSSTATAYGSSVLPTLN